MHHRRPSTGEIDSAKQHGQVGLWLDHVKLIEDDIEWLAGVERLTLWNVKVPPGLLGRIERLRWLDLRGGSATDIGVAKGATGLQYLAVNQVRGLCDLSLVSQMTKLCYLELYGLPKLTALPSCRRLVDLEHASLGLMRGLHSLSGLLHAPMLQELALLKDVRMSESDIKNIKKHPALQRFSWFAEDVPNRVWMPVVAAIQLPPVAPLSPDQWFIQRQRGEEI